MGSSPTLALSLLIFFLCNLRAIQGSIFIQPVTTVVIVNQIEYGIPVTVHCKSKNDDLGVHVLPLGQGYSFKFRPNLVGTTLFFCSFTWTGQHQIYWFNIFDDKRDAGKCTTCRWIIHAYSMCLQDPTNPGKDICYNYGDKEPSIV
ncbi:self-incompatibility protein 1 [Cucumis melo var. makuwa]|uniref:S-protein homolog n=1 Tax=Cucumis melo var. makuwa TaxID=1194695 RepID=A0A5A7U8G6_CUCMM|nr:self-incompatibility protein 1 [Cucumis melo var. makuwa]